MEGTGTAGVAEPREEWRHEWGGIATLTVTLDVTLLTLLGSLSPGKSGAIGGIVAHTEKPPTGWQAPCAHHWGTRAVHGRQYIAWGAVHQEPNPGCDIRGYTTTLLP